MSNKTMGELFFNYSDVKFDSSTASDVIVFYRNLCVVMKNTLTSSVVTYLCKQSNLVANGYFILDGEHLQDLRLYQFA